MEKILGCANLRALDSGFHRIFGELRRVSSVVRISPLLGDGNSLQISSHFLILSSN
jgi:hypothetical protein